jgi:5-keto-L-gluconate epimerase
LKIGLAIAPEGASHLAFVVFRDRLEVSMEKAARLGFDGIELALLDATEVDPGRLRLDLAQYRLELPVISSGRVFSEGKVWFTHPDQKIRREAVEKIKGLISLAGQLGSKVNIGRVRGIVHEGETRKTAEDRFIECMRDCADLAGTLGAEMLLEPVNRYEINFINNVSEALDLLDRLARPNVKVMPDVFHMNIEDASMVESLKQAGPRIGYVHFADSNRHAPGQGHLNLAEIVGVLRQVGYDWYATAEILPYPDPDTAAARAAMHLQQLFSAKTTTQV